MSSQIPAAFQARLMRPAPNMLSDIRDLVQIATRVTQSGDAGVIVASITKAMLKSPANALRYFFVIDAILKSTPINVAVFFREAARLHLSEWFTRVYAALSALDRYKVRRTYKAWTAYQIFPYEVILTRILPHVQHIDKTQPKILPANDPYRLAKTAQDRPLNNKISVMHREYVRRTNRAGAAPAQPRNRIDPVHTAEKKRRVEDDLGVALNFLDKITGRNKQQQTQQPAHTRPQTQQPKPPRQQPAQASNESLLGSTRRYGTGGDTSRSNGNASTRPTAAPTDSSDYSRVLHQRTINALYSGTQCPNCGFRESSAETLKAHLEWHFREQSARQAHAKEGKLRYRGHFDSLEDWIHHDGGTSTQKKQEELATILEAQVESAAAEGKAQGGIDQEQAWSSFVHAARYLLAQQTRSSSRAQKQSRSLYEVGAPTNDGVHIHYEPVDESGDHDDEITCHVCSESLGGDDTLVYLDSEEIWAYQDVVRVLQDGGFASHQRDGTGHGLKLVQCSLPHNTEESTSSGFALFDVLLMLNGVPQREHRGTAQAIIQRLQSREGSYDDQKASQYMSVHIGKLHNSQLVHCTCYAGLLRNAELHATVAGKKPAVEEAPGSNAPADDADAYEEGAEYYDDE